MTELSFEIASAPQHPLAVRLAFLLIFGFLFIGLSAVRRNNFPFLTLSLPIWLGFVALFLMLAEVAGAQSVTIGSGRRASAAGVAEAQIPLKWAFYVTSAVCGLHAMRRTDAARPLDRHSFFMVFSWAVILVPLAVWLSNRLLLPTSTYDVSKVRIAHVFAAIACAAFVTSTATVIRGRNGAPRLSRVTAIVIGCGTLACGLFVRELTVQLQQYAMAP
jgi:hypothetical protein